MGLGDVRASVLPKPVLIGAPLNGGSLSVRYFTPHACHSSLATTGAVSVAIAATLVYRATAHRGDAPPFTALMTSTYARRDGRWRLTVYTQTPVPG